MTAPCRRFEREGLADWTPAASSLDEHAASCAECQLERERYRRIIEAMRAIGAGATRRSDHVAAVLASEARAQQARRRRRLGAGALVAMAAAFAVLLWRWRAAPGEPELTIEVVAQAGPALRGEAHLGDTLRLRARRGAALWVYRNDRSLLVECPKQCQRDERAIFTEVRLDEVGRYQVVWLMPEPGLSPRGELEADITAARAAGARFVLREIEVQ